MAQDLYQYERMVEEALRGVVRDALRRAAREGLRGGHHFYIAFDTRHPDVTLPEHLRARYPEEMAIVLQHQFWDLEVGDANFSVTLSFQKQLEQLVIPFAAVRSFTDPSVKFVLEFPAPEAAATGTAGVPAPPQPTEKPTAEVVTLDSFRKR